MMAKTRGTIEVLTALFSCFLFCGRAGLLNPHQPKIIGTSRYFFVCNKFCVVLLGHGIGSSGEHRSFSPNYQFFGLGGVQGSPQ